MSDAAMIEHAETCAKGLGAVGCTCDALERANARITELASANREEAFADIRERLGEMAWGIGLPTPFVTYNPADFANPTPLALNPDQAERIMECIFHKLQNQG